MRRAATAVAGAAFAVILLAGCGAFAPDDSGSNSTPAVETESHSTGTEHITDGSDTSAPTPGQTDFPSTPEGHNGPSTAKNDAPLPSPEDLNSELMVAPDAQGSTGQPRGQHAVPERLWNGQVPVWAECTDEAAQAENAGHEPAGWPTGHQGGEPLPNPECHADFIELYEWEHFEEFMSCCEGIQNGTPMLSPDADEQRVYSVLWDKSQARADWSPGDQPDHDNDW